MAADFDWSAFVNSIDSDLPEDGTGPPSTETIEVKKRGRKPQPRYQVQKLITEVIVYTDTNNKTFGTQTFQQMLMFGEMTQGKLNKFISFEIESHKTEE